jgi:predicted enzyme related to lactoylglutathione lyase
MTEKTTYAPGTFCWPELTSTDQAAAEKFYGALFGWTLKETPMGPDSHYTIFLKDGQDVAAAAQMDKDAKTRGVPAYWLSYVSTTSVDQSVEKAKQLGGTLVAGPFDVMEHGRMAVLKDPTGATFALWQANQHPGATRMNEPFSLVWTELLTNDTNKAKAFYTGLFGWTTETMPGVGMEYTIWKRDAKDMGTGGMMQITPEMGPLPPNWMVYFSVTDADAIVAKAKSLGAKVLVEPKDIPKVGRMAVLSDPTGAAFSILKPDPQM